MSSHALFLGCIVPAREPSYELSIRKVFQILGTELVDLKDLSCCAPIPIESLSFKTSLAISAYNLALAEESDLDFITICNGCFQVLTRANNTLKKNVKLKAEVNKILSDVGKQYRGTKKVYDYLQVLYEDIGCKNINKKITKKLDLLNVATFYGCHLLKPSDVLKFDNPERPQILDELVEVTGAKSISYQNKTRCCGGLLQGISDNLATDLAKDKIQAISEAKADCIVTVCPFCFIQLDIGQLSVRRKYGIDFQIPVFHYTELLGLSMGLKPDDLGLKTHRISTKNLIERMELE